MAIREARRRQTLGEADRLIRDVGSWLQWRKDRDRDANGDLGRYDTQLAAISSEVLAATEKVRTLAEADLVTRPTGEVFNDYNLHDQRLVWVRYAWSYFKDKLDQRDDATLRPTLEAADEISWSCYAIFFVQAGLSVPAAPLPYIEYDYVPSALRTGQAHILNRRPGADAGPLKAYFAKLPVPLLRLPPATVTSPWSLALIAHEVGHLLQGSVEPAQQFFTTFSNRVRDRAAGAGASEGEQKQWANWSQEIFADLCMASTLGPWAVWALAPWVVTTEQAMTTALDYYPPPETRLYLLQQFAQGAGFAAEETMAARLELSGRDLPMARAVASLAQEPIAIGDEEAPLQYFLGGSAKTIVDEGRAYRWSEALLQGSEFLAESDKTSARDAVLAATRAHFLTIENGLDTNELGERCLRLIRECHDTGKRTGQQLAVPEQSLAEALFEIREEEIFGAPHI